MRTWIRDFYPESLTYRGYLIPPKSVIGSLSVAIQWWTKGANAMGVHLYPYVGMDQYLLIPFLGGWTSIYQLFWCSPGVQGFDTLPCIQIPSHGHMKLLCSGMIPHTGCPCSHPRHLLTTSGKYLEVSGDDIQARTLCGWNNSVLEPGSPSHHGFQYCMIIHDLDYLRVPPI